MCRSTVGVASLALVGSLLGQAALANSPVPFPCYAEACDRPGHDPSAMQRTAGGYYVTLVTGSGDGEAFGMKYLDPSDYSKGWRQGDNSYLVPSWLRNYEPWKSRGCGDGKTSACPFWAPDLPTSGNGIKPGGDDLIMYYSVPALDDEGDGCIGRATGRFHAPKDSKERAFINWTDAGEPVICSDLSSARKGAPHGIDPNVAVDAEGRWWLTYGSFSSAGPSGGGVWSVELDASTGLLGSAAKKQCGNKFPYCWSAGNSAFRNLANKPENEGKYGGENALEAAYLYVGNQYYYLFVNYYFCCRGMKSTYELHVGRSTSPTGPFLDRNGVDMTKGGSELVIGNITKTRRHKMVGPGHAGIMKDIDGQYAFTFDFMAIDSDDNQYQTQARVLTWDDAGWPVVGNTNFIPSSTVVV